MRFDGKVALVTGGGSGIGRATALRLASEGAAVAIMGRRIWALENVVREIGKAGGRAVAVVGDVSREDEARGAVELTVSSLGGLDILFNNAGVADEHDGDVTALSLEAWERTLAVNLTGTFLMSRFAVPALRRRGGGSIVNNASTLGLVGLPGLAAYCASKGGVVLLTRAMALDHAKEKIRVNAICPAVVDTDMPRLRFGAADSDALNNKLGALHPIGRVGKPEEIAAVVALLASDESAFVTGAVWTVDGGLTTI